MPVANAMLDQTSSTRRNVTSGMSGAALNAANSGFTLPSPLLCDLLQPEIARPTKAAAIKTDETL